MHLDRHASAFNCGQRKGGHPPLPIPLLLLLLESTLVIAPVDVLLLLAFVVVLVAFLVLFFLPILGVQLRRLPPSPSPRLGIYSSSFGFSSSSLIITHRS